MNREKNVGTKGERTLNKTLTKDFERNGKAKECRPSEYSVELPKRRLR